LARNKRREEGGVSRLSQRRTLVAVLAIVLVGSAISAISLFLLRPQPLHFSMNAVIVDQLSLDFPNSTFVNNATAMLKDYGFDVSYVYNESVTVDFFHGLAKGNYGIIVLRTHTAMRNESDVKTVDIFTSELFGSSKHTDELDSGQLVKGILTYSGEKQYFAVTSEFIKRLDGSFPKSIVFMMGCWSNKAQYDQVAREFVSKGATVCTGWSEMVSPEKTDSETLRLISSVLQNETIQDAVDLTRSYIYFDEKGYTVKSEVRLCPQTSGAAGLRLPDLVSESQDSAGFTMVVQRIIVRKHWVDWLAF
jgi:hypothetical protein